MDEKIITKVPVRSMEKCVIIKDEAVVELTPQPDLETVFLPADIKYNLGEAEKKLAGIESQYEAMKKEATTAAQQEVDYWQEKFDIAESQGLMTKLREQEKLAQDMVEQYKP